MIFIKKNYLENNMFMHSIFRDQTITWDLVHRYFYLGKYNNSFKNQYKEDGVCNAFSIKSPCEFSISAMDNVKYIVNHYTQIDDFDKAIRILSNSVSSHVLIDKDGTIYRLVPDNMKAWHAGSGNILNDSFLNKENYLVPDSMNDWSIGIEILNNGVSSFTDAQVEANCYFMASLITTYNIQPEHIIGHNDWSIRKTDPGPYWYSVRYKFATSYEDYGLNTQPIIWAPAPQFSGNFDYNQENIAHLQELLREFGYDIPESEDGKLANNTIKMMSTFKMNYTPQYKQEEFMNYYEQWYFNSEFLYDSNQYLSCEAQHNVDSALLGMSSWDYSLNEFLECDILGVIAA